MKLAVNHLPVLTWNHLKLNKAEFEVDDAALQDIKAAGKKAVLKTSSLPMGIEHEKGVDSASLYKRFSALFVKTDPEKIVAGKFPIYNKQSFATGMGHEIDSFMEDVDADVYTVTDSFDHDKPVTIGCALPEGATGLSKVFIHAKAGSESTFIFSFTTLPKECDYLAECGKCVEQKQVLEMKKEGAADIEPDAAQAGLVGSQLFVYLEPGASVTLHVVQMLDEGSAFFHDIGICQEEGSLLTMTKLDLGAGQVYEGLNNLQKGDRSIFSMDMGYLGLPGSSMDINYNDVFTGKKAEGRMYFKEALLKDAKKTFRGTLDFRQYSTGSKGDEQEDIILLGDEVVNRTIPLILCEEEDVDGRHAASVGSLPADMLFYMQTRGISRKRAEQMMVLSSLQNISNKVPSEALQKAVRNSICRVFETTHDSDLQGEG
ncbi:MAG: SufD family Fe-S cluster assembly protein [Lachnospiraceae bacterium]|nr:SufD family Fe-S cluster assembly protein [Lachnospiraceae bacterium]